MFRHFHATSKCFYVVDWLVPGKTWNRKYHAYKCRQDLSMRGVPDTNICMSPIVSLTLVHQTFKNKLDTNMYWLEIQNTTGARRCFSPDNTHSCWRSFILRGCFIVGEGLKGVLSNTFFTLLLASATSTRFAMVSQTTTAARTVKSWGWQWRTAIGQGVWFWRCSGGFNHNCVWKCGFETMVWELLFWNNVVHHVLWSTFFRIWQHFVYVALCRCSTVSPFVYIVIWEAHLFICVNEWRVDIPTQVGQPSPKVWPSAFTSQGPRACMVAARFHAVSFVIEFFTAWIPKESEGILHQNNLKTRGMKTVKTPDHTPALPCHLCWWSCRFWVHLKGLEGLGLRLCKICLRSRKIYHKSPRFLHKDFGNTRLTKPNLALSVTGLPLTWQKLWIVLGNPSQWQLVLIYVCVAGKRTNAGFAGHHLNWSQWRSRRRLFEAHVGNPKTTHVPKAKSAKPSGIKCNSGVEVAPSTSLRIIPGSTIHIFLTGCPKFAQEMNVISSRKTPKDSDLDPR